MCVELGTEKITTEAGTLFPMITDVFQIQTRRETAIVSTTTKMILVWFTVHRKEMNGRQFD